MPLEIMFIFGMIISYIADDYYEGTVPNQGAKVYVYDMDGNLIKEQYY